ncbi:hypothetical protein NMY22_g15060 [Coprinellus aureogranulatus]|nr:hypothetical protein NMY22_g15060 [Coprinellus aureogranulatus]
MVAALVQSVISWFWRFWSLLRSFAVFTKRRPPLPRSASQPELEKGLFTFGATASKGPPATKRSSGDPPLQSQDHSALPGHPLDYRFTFEKRPSATSGDPPHNAVPSDSHAAVRSKPRHPRRHKSSRESIERRRQRRAGRVPDFVPPPEIHIEDWSDNTITSTASQQLLPFWQFPEFQLGPLTKNTVPFVIITPSTPSEENTSAMQSFSMTLSTPVEAKPSPPPSPGLPETSLECDHVAQVFGSSSGSDESTPSLEQYPAPDGIRSSFSFTDSLLEAAFGQLSTIDPTTPLDLDLDPSAALSTDCPAVPDLPNAVGSPPTDWTDDSFHPQFQQHSSNRDPSSIWTD